MRPILALLALLPLIACGPVSREQAERDCLHTARLAQQPRGSVGIGVDSNGNVSPQFDVTVSSDYLSGRDPSQVYDSCVMRKSGQMPSRSFSSIPASR